MAARNEVLAVQVQRDRAELRRLAAANGAAVANANLVRLVGLPAGTRIEPAERVDAPDAPPPDVEALVGEALAARPEAASLRVADRLARGERPRGAGLLPPTGRGQRRVRLRLAQRHDRPAPQGMEEHLERRRRPLDHRVRRRPVGRVGRPGQRPGRGAAPPAGGPGAPHPPGGHEPRARPRHGPGRSRGRGRETSRRPSRTSASPRIATTRASSPRRSCSMPRPLASWPGSTTPRAVSDLHEAEANLKRALGR